MKNRHNPQGSWKQRTWKDRRPRDPSRDSVVEGPFAPTVLFGFGIPGSFVAACLPESNRRRNGQSDDGDQKSHLQSILIPL